MRRIDYGSSRAWKEGFGVNTKGGMALLAVQGPQDCTSWSVLDIDIG
jgi:hypothetical protein